MGREYCCVPGCFNDERKHKFLSWHRFPKDPLRRNLWLLESRRDPRKRITCYTYVCSEHFTPEDYRPLLHSKKKILKVNAVPSIFPWNKEQPVKDRKCSSERKSDWSNSGLIVSSSVQESGKKTEMSADAISENNFHDSSDAPSMFLVYLRTEPDGPQFGTMAEQDNGLTDTSVTDQDVAAFVKMLENDDTKNDFITSENLTFQDPPALLSSYRFGADSTNYCKHECPVCHHYFPSQVQLDIHLEMYVGEEILMCSKCDEVFTSAHDFEAHMLIHTELKFHKCPNCTEMYTPTLYRSTKHNTDKCRLCFYTNQDVLTQKDQETGKKVFVCHVCWKKYHYKSCLTRHRKTHA